MKDRIIQFLRENNLTSTKFADIIGVQRSSISHILSGRNKPSFDFIEKMLLAYPDLNAQWLLTGKGYMLTNQPSLFEKPVEQNNNNLPSPDLHNKDLDTDIKDIMDSKAQTDKKVLNLSSNKTDEAHIERVIVFYSDGSFKDYKPKAEIS